MTISTGYIIDDYGSRFSEFAEQMGRWFASGKLKYREDMVDGLDKAPDALSGCYKGKTSENWWYVSPPADFQSPFIRIENLLKIEMRHLFFSTF